MMSSFRHVTSKRRHALRQLRNLLLWVWHFNNSSDKKKNSSDRVLMLSSRPVSLCGFTVSIQLLYK
jgi:hypothetical protein